MKSIRPNYNIMKALPVGLLGIVSLLASCKGLIPDDLDALGDDVTITTTEFSPYLGRRTTYENIVNVSNKSTLPLSFQIMGPRTADGVEAPELLEKYPVKIWTDVYTGKETTLEEIENKRKIEYRPLLEIQQKSGDIVFWNSGDDSFIKTLPSEGYLFDVEIANTGGRRYVRNLALKPKKEREYEPSQYDDVLGIAKDAFLRPTLTMNLFGDRTGTPTTDVRMYIFEDKLNVEKGNTLTFSALDSLGKAIDIRKFKDTNFEHLVHGFNPRFHDGKVTYDVVYPMPLISYPTRYTSPSGNRARMNLKYNRIGKGGFMREAFLMFDFAIFREGHWEIQLRFNGETPNFENEQ